MMASFAGIWRWQRWPEGGAQLELSHRHPPCGFSSVWQLQGRPTSEMVAGLKRKCSENIGAAVWPQKSPSPICYWWRCSRATKFKDIHLLLGEGQRICGHVLKLSQHLLVENWTVSFLITSDFSTIFLPCLPFLTLETMTWFRTGK